MNGINALVKRLQKKKNRDSRALVVHWLGLCSQCRGLGLDS